ncbi:MAG: acyltransferase, partial [Rickettsiales bacterium]|nr:acyltransferase [Rickettsiales bacterium]
GRPQLPHRLRRADCMSHAQPQQHYLTLDAARGLAASAVMLFHIHTYIYPQLATGLLKPIFSNSYLAVDLFFLMSGLVITRAYEAKRQTGAMSFWGFCRVRFIRLWPLYFAGTLMGFAYMLIKNLLKPEEAMPIDTALTTLALNLAFLPNVAKDAQGIYPFDPAAWSLALEWGINLVYAAIAIRLSTRVLAGFTVVSGMGLILAALRHGNMDMGWDAATAIGGIWRICFSFTLGVILFRLLEAGKLHKTPRINATLLLALLSLCLFTPFAHLALEYELLCVFLVFPAFVVMGCHTHPTPRAQRAFWQLGRLSYAIYILHTPLIMLFCGLWKFLFKTDPTHMPAVSATPLLLSILIACAVLTTLDERLRKRLTRKRKT